MLLGLLGLLGLLEAAFFFVVLPLSGPLGAVLAWRKGLFGSTLAVLAWVTGAVVAGPVCLLVALLLPSRSITLR